MKKNITINLFGQLYHIDEDAYELLKKYEENMRRYFSSKDGGEEIVDDIEHRIAELLAEHQTEGNNAIDIEQVQNIIHRIGNPEEIIEDESEKENADTEKNETDSTQETNKSANRMHSPYKKRLFRDIQDAMLGGVTSGIAHYFGIHDPILLRLLWVITFFVSASSALIIYIILWIIIPPATTPEQRLQMHGKPVNPQTLNEEIIKESQQGNEYNPPKRTSVRLLNTALSFGVFLLKLFLLFFGGCILIGIFFVVISFFAFFIGGTSTDWIMSNLDIEKPFVAQLIGNYSGQIWTIFACLLVIICFPIFLLIRRLVQSNYQPSSTKTRLCYVIVWLSMIAVTLILSIHTGMNFQFKIENQNRIENTHNGIYLHPSSWAYLEENNWDVIQLQNTLKYINGYSNNLFHESNSRRYLRICSNTHNEVMRCQLERHAELEAGIYRLEAIANTNGEGCYLYTQINDSTLPSLTPIPFTNDSIYKIKNMPWSIARQYNYFTKATDSINWPKVQKSSRDREWCFIQSEPFKHKGGTIKYGITNDTRITHRPWTGDRFAVYDIVLRKVKPTKTTK